MFGTWGLHLPCVSTFWQLPRSPATDRQSCKEKKYFDKCEGLFKHDSMASELLSLCLLGLKLAPLSDTRRLVGIYQDVTQVISESNTDKLNQTRKQQKFLAGRTFAWFVSPFLRDWLYCKFCFLFLFLRVGFLQIAFLLLLVTVDEFLCRLPRVAGRIVLVRVLCRFLFRSALSWNHGNRDRNSCADCCCFVCDGQLACTWVFDETSLFFAETKRLSVTLPLSGFVLSGNAWVWFWSPCPRSRCLGMVSLWNAINPAPKKNPWGVFTMFWARVRYGHPCCSLFVRVNPQWCNRIL